MGFFVFLGGIFFFLASIHRGIPLGVILNLIVETFNYENIMSRIDYLLFITSKYENPKIIHFFSETASLIGRCLDVYF